MGEYIIYLKEGEAIDYNMAEDGKYKPDYRGKIVVPSEMRSDGLWPVYFYKNGSMYASIDPNLLTEFIEPLIKKLEAQKTEYEHEHKIEELHKKLEKETSASENIAKIQGLLRLLDKVNPDDLIRLKKEGIL